MNITSQAAQAINTLVAGHPGAGLRIATRGSDAGTGQLDLSLSVAESPSETDSVAEENGAHVFIEDRVAPLLEDKTLDVSDSGDAKQLLFQLVP